jgi:hypothetical protein
MSYKFSDLGLSGFDNLPGVDFLKNVFPLNYRILRIILLLLDDNK